MNRIYQETRSLNNIKDFNIKINDKEPIRSPNNSSLHWHSYYEVLFIYDDNTNLQVLDASYPLKKGTIVFLSPYTIHNTVNFNSHFNKEIVLHFSDKLIEQITFDKDFLHLLTHNLFLRTPFFFNIENEKAIEALHRLLDIYPQTTQKRSSLMLLQGYLFILFTSIFEDLDFGVNPTNALEHSFSLFSIRKYLDQQIEEQNRISLNDTASQFGYESTYFSKLFKTTFGFHFKDYVSSLKIQRAKILLQSKEYSVSQVSDLLNYSSTQNFCRAYKAITGLSPYQYKKNIRKYTHM